MPKTTKRTPLDKLSAPLAALVKLLQKRGGTALSMKDRLGCSKPTVYGRLAVLQSEHGYKLKVEEVRENATGPLSKHYSLAR